MTLLVDLEEFVADHRPQGTLTGDATEPAWNGYLLTVACSCGVTLERWIMPLDADRNLLRAADECHRSNAVGLIPRWRLPFESHDGVSQRRNHDLSDAPLFAIALVYRAVRLATLLNHPHTWHTGEPLQEVLVEIGVVPAHHDEHLGIRKRLRGQGFERLFFVTRTDSVRRRWVVIGFPLTQVAGLAFPLARRADDLHPDQAPLP